MVDEINIGHRAWQELIGDLAAATGKSKAEVSRVFAKERLDARLFKLARNLKHRYKLGLLSNAHHQHLQPVVNALGLQDLFDVIIVSSQVGMVKPEPKIFRHALRLLGVPAEKAILVDDIVANTKAAESLGMRAVRYRGYRQLIKELKNYGIEL